MHCVSKSLTMKVSLPCSCSSCPEICRLKTGMFHFFTFVRPAISILGWQHTFCFLDVSCACPLTDRVLFHAHTTHLAAGALLLPGHMFRTASQHTCEMRTLPIMLKFWQFLWSYVYFNCRWHVLNLIVASAAIEIPLLTDWLTDWLNDNSNNITKDNKSVRNEDVLLYSLGHL